MSISSNCNAECIELYKINGEKAGERKRTVDKPDEEGPPKPKKKRVTKSGKDYIGTAVAKMFDDGVIYYGIIKSYDGDFWKVRYEDGDREDFDLDDIKAGIELCQKRKKETEDNNEN